jgi:hypothetical protein
MLNTLDVPHTIYSPYQPYQPAVFYTSYKCGFSSEKSADERTKSATRFFKSLIWAWVSELKYCVNLSLVPPGCSDSQSLAATFLQDPVK